MNQLEDDGERMVELGHPAVGPIQVRGTEMPWSRGRPLPQSGGAPGRLGRGRRGPGWGRPSGQWMGAQGAAGAVRGLGVAVPRPTRRP